MNTDEREELASLYALGLLEGAELAAFERQVAADPSLGALVSELENAATHVALSAPQVPAPSAVRSLIFQEIENLRKTEQPASVVAHSFSWIPWALAAGLAIFAGFTWSEKSRISTAYSQLAEQNSALTTRLAGLEDDRVRLTERVTGLESEKSRLTARIASLESEKSQLAVRVASLEARNPLEQVKAITLVPQPEAPAGAAVVAVWDSRRQAGVLDLSKLPAAAPDKDYQLWIISPDSAKPIDGGLVSTAAVQAPFQTPRPLTQVVALAISLEPKGGSESARGPIIYLGTF